MGPPNRNEKPRETRDGREATTSRLGMSSGTTEALSQPGAGADRPCAFRSRHHRISDGEVIKAWFVRPLAGVVSRQAIGRIGRAQDRRISSGPRASLSGAGSTVLQSERFPKGAPGGRSWLGASGIRLGLRVREHKHRKQEPQFDAACPVEPSNPSVRPLAPSARLSIHPLIPHSAMSCSLAAVISGQASQRRPAFSVQAFLRQGGERP